jgi:hypothetical protein
MPNSKLAKLISQRMSTGLPYPGDAYTKQQPMIIALPAFRTAGLPPQLADQVANTVELVGQAIIHLIETEGDSVIIGRGELNALRAADQGPGVPLTVMCRACNKPMLWLTITNGRAVIDPRLLGGVNTVCPHT